jgi:hypothetical protein
MRFPISPTGSFEIVGIKKVVENVVKVVDGIKYRTEETKVWKPRQTKKGLRWLKYQWGFDFPSVLDGMSPEEMHMYLHDCMMAESVTVWFSGDTCNIEFNQTLQEKIEAEACRQCKALINDAMKDAMKEFVHDIFDSNEVRGLLDKLRRDLNHGKEGS